MGRRSTVLTLLVALAPLLACDVPPPPTAHCVVATFSTALATPVPADPVDILLVIDDSPSMAGEQAHASSELSRIIAGLATGDTDGNGVVDFSPPFEDLHVGVITADLGTGSTTAPGCTAAGDAARLVPGRCASAVPPFLTYCVDRGDVTPIATGTTCAASVGAAGCGYQQPLDAALMALVSAPNPGFLRDDSLVIVVVVSSDDDCSITTPDVVDPSASPALRCATHAASLASIAALADGLRSLRPTNPNLVQFAAITGVPPDRIAHSPSSTVDFGALLADPRMTPQPDATGARLVPVCSSSRGEATPAPRLARAAQAFGERGGIESICNDSWAPIFGLYLGFYGPWDLPTNVCLARALRRGSDGRVACTLTAELAVPGASCLATAHACADLGDLADPVAIGVGASGGALCRLRQVAVDAATRGSGGPPSGAGFYYDDYTSETLMRCAFAPQRVVLTDGPIYGATLHVDCTGYSVPRGIDPIGTPCAHCTGDGGVTAARAYVCDPASATCQYGCTTDADCPAGWTCGTNLPVPFCGDPACG